jgi:hypothetical protein
MFQQFIAIISGSRYLRSYSSNICVVDAYGLQVVPCGQLSLDSLKKVKVLRNRPEYLEGGVEV